MAIMGRHLFAAAALSFIAAVPQTPPAESPGIPEARASFDAGRAADRAGDKAKAIGLFRKAIDLDPRYVEAHDAFMNATESAAYAYDSAKRSGDEVAQKKATAELKTLYEGWAKAHPDMAVYEWALAKLAGKDWTSAEQHLTRATAISPAFARPYQDLSLIAELRGDNVRRIEYLERAADLNPTDASYFFYYASAMKSVDAAVSVRLLQEVATKFPGTERGAQGLYWAAYETQDIAAKLAIYERLKSEFPPEKFSWSESGMSDLFDVLAGVAPDKAAGLAADMLRRISAKSEQKSWTDLAEYAAALGESAALVAKGDGKAAIQRLDSVKPARPRSGRPAIFRRRTTRLRRLSRRRRPKRSSPRSPRPGALPARRLPRSRPISGACARPRRSRPLRSRCRIIPTERTSRSRTTAAGSCSSISGIPRAARAAASFRHFSGCSTSTRTAGSRSCR